MDPCNHVGPDYALGGPPDTSSGIRDKASETCSTVYAGRVVGNLLLLLLLLLLLVVLQFVFLL